MRLYLSYSLSYRDVEEIMAERGASVDHSTIQRWVERYGKDLETVFRHNYPTHCKLLIFLNAFKIKTCYHNLLIPFRRYFQGWKWRKARSIKRFQRLWPKISLMNLSVSTLPAELEVHQQNCHFLKYLTTFWNFYIWGANGKRSLLKRQMMVSQRYIIQVFIGNLGDGKKMVAWTLYFAILYKPCMIMASLTRQ